MARRIVQSIALLLVAAFPVLAADREAEAKRYAADLKSKDAKVRATAATELGKLGQLQRKLAAPYISDLTKALTDSDAKVRSEAARALGLVDPEDKKEAVSKIAGILKDEKSETAREGQEMGLGELGATAEDGDIKKMARDALMEARKKFTDSKREQKTIQAALLLISGPKKKN